MQVVGLDTVELVLAVEEHFSIDISDAAASKIETVGQLHEYAASELLRLGRHDRTYGQIYDELKDIICRQTGIDPRQVQPEARFVKDLRMD